MVKLFKKHEEDDGTRFVINVDEDGLSKHKTPGGTKTKDVLHAGDKVKVVENQGYWSVLDDDTWVWSFNLSKDEPETKKVFNAKKPVPIYNSDEEQVGELHNGDVVQIYSKTKKKYKISKDDKWVYQNKLK